MLQSRLKSRIALRVIQFLDMVSFAAIFVYARESTLTGQGLEPVKFSNIHLSGETAVFLVVVAVIWRYIFILSGNYNFRFFDGWKTLGRIFASCTLGIGVSLLLALPAGIQLDWVAFPMLIYSIAIPFFLLFRAVISAVLFIVRSMGRNLRSTVIVGLNRRSHAMWQRLRISGMGLDFKGYFDDRQWSPSTTHQAPELPQLGDLADFNGYLSKHPVDQVLLALPIRSHYDEIYRIINQCADQGIQVWLLSELFDLPAYTTSKLNKVSEETFLQYMTNPHSDMQFELKRFIDIILSLCALFILSPVFLIIAILIYLDDGRPIFYMQERVGLNKRRFKMFKFRTMVKDAEKRQAALERENEYDGAAFKISNDPRVTKRGAFLRRTSLDEIPQFLNVLMGTMSLVGPRPLPIRDFERFYNDRHRMRFSIKPGITCLWQVSGRSNIDFEEWMKLDLEYVRNWTLLLDLELLFRTVGVVMAGKGAY